MNRKEIKNKALNLLEDNFWVIWFSIFLMFCMLGIIEYVFTFLNFNSDLYEILLYFIVVQLIISPFSIGFNYCILRIVRKDKMYLKDLFKFYPNFINIFLVSLVIQLFFSIGFTLFIIPGIIVVLVYCFVNFIIADGEFFVIDSLRASRELIYGYKFDYFKFLISFIGWWLIVIFTFGTAIVFVLPYFLVSNAVYYDCLKLKKLNV